MKRLYKQLMAWLTGSSLLLIFTVVLVSSLMRYLFDAPLQWSEEVARYGMIYGALFGTVLCYLDDLHIKFELLENLLSDGAKRVCKVLTDLSALACGLVLTWAGFGFTASRGELEAPGTGLPMSLFQSAMWIGGICLTIAALFKLADYLHTNSQQSE
ncbi:MULTISPECIES: TRAP transporter small permease [Marinobacter]|uniref:TRAP transporter small permease n=1 Tax=Marinobacter TaxID=2742 RepID=UPI000DAEBFD9|nr:MULTISPECIES: TRAP transporter small permease [Marinobacter]